MNPGLTRPLVVGDKVWSKRFGYGQVTYVNQDALSKYPYNVRFDDREQLESFSELGAHQISKPNATFDLAGPLRKDGTIEPNEPIKVAQTITVKNKEGYQEGTIIYIDGCKIFRSGDSMVVLPQNDDLWLKQQFSF